MQAPPSIRIPAAPGPPKMCKHCNVKPSNPGFSFCGKTCGKAFKAGRRGTATTGAQPASGGMCANCNTRPAYAGHRYCGKTCARTAGRHKQPYSPPVIGYNPAYHPPTSPSYGGTHGPPPNRGGYPTQGFGYTPPGPSFNYPPPTGQMNTGGYNSGWSGRPWPQIHRRHTGTPNRRRPPSADYDSSSEDDYPSESDDDRRRQTRKPVRRSAKNENEDEDEDFSGSLSEHSSDGDRSNRRRRGRQRPMQRADSYSNTASSSRVDPLCVVCRRYPKHSGHDFCSKRCRDSLAQSQMPQNLAVLTYPVNPGFGYGPIPGPFMGGARPDMPPSYNDVANWQ